MAKRSPLLTKKTLEEHKDKDLEAFIKGDAKDDEVTEDRQVKKVRLNCMIDEDLHSAFKVLAAQRKSSMSEIVIDLIRRELEEDP